MPHHPLLEEQHPAIGHCHQPLTPVVFAAREIQHLLTDSEHFRKFRSPRGVPQPAAFGSSTSALA
jgi:hypothetical protein